MTPGRLRCGWRRPRPVIAPCRAGLASKDGVEVIVHHRFLLPCETVYGAFLDVDTARKFMFATPSGEMVVAEIDPRTGGSFTFVDRRDGVDVMHIGEYLEIQHPKRLVFSLIVPQYSSESTRVALDFIWKNTSVCDVMLRHSGVAKEHEEQAAIGWKDMLKAADEVLQAKEERGGAARLCYAQADERSKEAPDRCCCRRDRCAGVADGAEYRELS